MLHFGKRHQLATVLELQTKLFTIMANILKTDRSAYEPQWTLPTARKEYILYTPQSQIAQLHSNERMIAPIWTKVSRTPWQNSAELCGGYGRKMQVTN